MKRLAESATLYVGNLSFFSTEEQVSLYSFYLVYIFIFRNENEDREKEGSDMNNKIFFI